MIARIALLALALACMVSTVAAQVPPPPSTDFAPRLGQRLPLDARVVDEKGEIEPFFTSLRGRPIMLVFGYYGCSNLCSVLLEGLATALPRAHLVSGRDVDVVIVSIDPLDTPDAARRRKALLVQQGLQGIVGDWHFLTASQTAIDRLTRAVGFTYRYDTPTRQYAHPAGLVILTAEGDVSSYVFGASFSPQVLQNRTATARAAMVTPPGDERWLLCFHYDPKAGRYTPVATALMRGSGVLVAAALGALIARNLRRSTRKTS